MEFREAVDRLIAQYEKDRENKYIRDPVAHALYEVWQEADADTRIWKNPEV